MDFRNNPNKRAPDMVNHPNRSTASLPPLARALKAWRQREGLSQAQAADLLGIPVARWRDMEQRGTSPETHVANAAGRIILSLL